MGRSRMDNSEKQDEDKQNKNTTQCVLDTTRCICKQTQIT